MKKQNLVIEFATEAKAHPIPRPAKLSIPTWYKNQTLFLDTNNVMKAADPIQHTMKRCVPFLDSFTSGYLVELWCDVLVKKDSNGKANFIYRVEKAPFEERIVSTTLDLPVPAGHSFRRFAWQTPYYTQVPKGYSILITHPLNRFDLPFTTLSAIVDADEVMYAGSVPFFLRDDFEGLIEKGTPLYQVLPFKRENWDSKENNTLIEKGQLNLKSSFAVLFGWYKRTVWKKKEYN